MAAGFGSCRRFNDAFRNTYRRAPRELRRAGLRGATASGSEEVVLRLAYRPPYDWAHVQAFLATRAVAGVERVDARGYARTVACEGGHALICVRALPGKDALELRVAGAPPAVLLQLSTVARRVFRSASASCWRPTRSSGRCCGRVRVCVFPGPGIRSSARCARYSGSR